MRGREREIWRGKRDTEGKEGSDGKGERGRQPEGGRMK